MILRNTDSSRLVNFTELKFGDTFKYYLDQVNHQIMMKVKPDSSGINCVSLSTGELHIYSEKAQVEQVYTELKYSINPF